jgi:hypothetical protein
LQVGDRVIDQQNVRSRLPQGLLVCVAISHGVIVSSPHKRVSDSKAAFEKSAARNREKCGEEHGRNLMINYYKFGS